VVTCEFDPLRDEGAAYADALAAAGVEVTHLPQRGQIHPSLHAVDLVISGAPARVEMGGALRRFAGTR
jgi:acetyl esterase/lipase